MEAGYTSRGNSRMMDKLTSISTSTAMPAAVANSDEPAQRRFLEFFTAQI